MKRILVIFAVVLSATWSNAQSLKISQLFDSVYIVTTYNTYESKPFPANCMYVLTTEGAILIDSPWDTTQLIPLMDSIQVRHNQSVIFCLATHFHDDRTGGFNLLNELGVPTYSTTLTQAYCTERGEGIAKNTFSADTTFEIGGVEFETFYPGPGHAPDNIVVWFPYWGILYGGCFVKSTESKTLGYTGDADLASWKAGILAVKKRYKQPNYIITGHQDWLSTRSLQHTLKLLEENKPK